MPRSLQDILDHADELADQFERFDVDQACDVSSPEMVLRRAAWKRARAEAEVAQAVAAARDGGVSWSAIGGVLGTSGQAAQKRYGQLLRSAQVRQAKRTTTAAKSAARKAKREANAAKREARAAKRRADAANREARREATGRRGT